MPSTGVPLTPEDRLLTTDEIKRAAKAFVTMGVTKIRLTGGEPTLRTDLLDIVRYLKSLRPLGLESIALTTNGLVLHRMLPQLVEAGLTHVNISIDSLRPQRFGAMSRMPDKTLAKVLNGIESAVATKARGIRLKVKINVVVMRHSNEDEVVDFVEFARERDLEVRFIEYMPFNSNAWSTKQLVPASELMNTIQNAYGNDEIIKREDSTSDTTRHYAVRGHRGQFGFISSMTDHFCASCNRVRLLADGNLKVCLFGNREVSLKKVLGRQNADQDFELKSLISEALGRKHYKHAGLKDPKAIWEAAEGEKSSTDSRGHGREMSRIGG